MHTSPSPRAARTGIRSRLRVALAGAVALGVAWSSLTAIAAPSPAAALAEPVVYELPNADFATPLAGTWTVNGTAEQQRTLELSPGGVAYQGIPVKTDGSGPAAGDIVEASVDVTLHADVTADSTVLVRITDGSAILAEWTDLTGLPRGQRTTVTTQISSNEGRVGTAANAVYVELHDDTAGTIEVHDVRLGATRGTEHVNYQLPNSDFAQALAPSNWSSANARIATSVLLAPNSVVSQNLTVGSVPTLPQTGDALALSVEAFLDPRVDAGTSALAQVRAGDQVLLQATDSTAVQRAQWQKITATGDGVVADGVTGLEVALRNDTGFALRLRDVRLTGTRDEGSDDLNGDGTIDRADVTWFQAAVRDGADDSALDYDDDGQVTTADISFYIRFVLGDTSEVFANLTHLDFLSEHVVLDGKPAMIVHLYAEPKNRADLSQGYEWVGDPQEGVSALDDVARATIVYAEHYATYRDEHSYDQMRRGLEFAMWMQAPNGDFDNFVARDAQGNLFKKDSQSSQTSFSFWAARAYEAMATALPLIKATDADLSARVTARLDLCLNRVGQLISPEYGQREANGAPKWLLLDDVWLSSTAVSALAKHSQLLSGDERATAIDLIRDLGEGIAFYQAGDFDEYPLGAVRHNNGNWYEWGSIQTKALATAGTLTEHPEWVDAARLLADSFLTDMLISGRSMEIGPNKTGLPQINYGTASYVDNLLTLYSATGDVKYAELAGVAATWWTGNNPAGVPMFDQILGLAFDGITTNGVNTNSGAESVDEALRAILRIQRVPEAIAAMTATKVDERTATTVEIEDLIREGRPADELIPVAGSGLNDPAHAVVTQQSSSGLDEQAIYADAQQVDTEQPIYDGWRGSKALFAVGSGWNNVRIFDGGYIYTDIGVGGPGQAQPGDSLMLEFSGLLQFRTDLDAELVAVNAAGVETLLADDSGFQYNPRTWYSGPGAVRTTLKAEVPADADHLRIRFSNSSTNPVEYEGFVTVTIASLYRLGVPEVRYGSSAFSNRAYAHLDAGSQTALTLNVPAAGAQNLFLSAIDQPAAEAQNVSLSSAGRFDLSAQLAGTAGAVTIRTLGRASLEAGTIPLTISTGTNAAADVDALILYPVETFATYRRLDGSELMILRDADARAFYAGTPQEVQSRGTAPVVTTQPQTTAVYAGQTATFTAAATGDPAPTVQWELSADGSTWAPIAGATTTTLQVPAVTRSDSGHLYRAVFTNRKGTAATEAAALEVNTVVVTASATGEKPANTAGWFTGPVDITLTDNSASATVEYRVGTVGEWLPVTGPVAVTSDGTTTVNFRATETGSPIPESAGSITVKLDRVAPITTASVNPGSGVVPPGSTITATFTATDVTSGVVSTEYSTDDGATWVPATPEGVSFTTVGAHVVKYRSVDVAGNVETAKEITLTVKEPQATAQVTLSSADTSPVDGWYQQSVKVTLKAPNTTYKVQHRINGGAWRTYSTPFTISPSGVNTVDHRLTKAGVAVAGSDAQTLVKIDKSSPVVGIVRTPAVSSGTVLNPIALTFTLTDKYSGPDRHEYQVNGGEWLPVGPDAVVFDTVGSYTVKSRGYDKAGNVSVSKPTTLTIRANPTPTIKPSVTSTKRGAAVTVTITGFARFDDVAITFGGASLGTVLTDVNGKAKVTIRVPVDAPLGATSVVATGSSGSPTATTRVTVKQ